MSKSEQARPAKKAVALQYGARDAAPVVVAAGSGYMAEKIVEVAAQSGVPVYEDTSLATALTQLQLGREIPPQLYSAIVEIYLYFLHYKPNGQDEPAENVAQQAPLSEDNTMEGGTES